MTTGSINITLRGVCVFKTITTSGLLVTLGAFFDVATGNVKFAFENAAVMARLVGSIPVVCFASVLNAGELRALNKVSRLRLRLDNSLGPSLDHSNSAVFDKFRHQPTPPVTPAKAATEAPPTSLPATLPGPIVLPPPTESPTKYSAGGRLEQKTPALLPAVHKSFR